jgi:hypothetical protein
MFVIVESYSVNLDELSKALGLMGIKNLNIMSINSTNNNTIDYTSSDVDCKVTYIDLSADNLFNYLNEGTDFSKYNKNTLYIIRRGNFLDIKNIFARIEGLNINVGRGGSQKAHMISPLDFRLTSYLLAMFNFDYNLINKINAFDYIDKDRYLSYHDTLALNKNINNLNKCRGGN